MGEQEKQLEIFTTEHFDKWFSGITDKVLLSAIYRRFYNIEYKQLFGDINVINADIKELKFKISGGIRVYYAMQGNKVVILLCGGDKSSQTRDVIKANKILKEIQDGNA